MKKTVAPADSGTSSASVMINRSRRHRLASTPLTPPASSAATLSGSRGLRAPAPRSSGEIWRFALQLSERLFSWHSAFQAAYRLCFETSTAPLSLAGPCRECQSCPRQETGRVRGPPALLPGLGCELRAEPERASATGMWASSTFSSHSPRTRILAQVRSAAPPQTARTGVPALVRC